MLNWKQVPPPPHSLHTHTHTHNTLSITHKLTTICQNSLVSIHRCIPSCFFVFNIYNDISFHFITLYFIIFTFSLLNFLKRYHNFGELWRTLRAVIATTSMKKTAMTFINPLYSITKKYPRVLGPGPVYSSHDWQKVVDMPPCTLIWEMSLLVLTVFQISCEINHKPPPQTNCTLQRK